MCVCIRAFVCDIDPACSASRELKCLQSMLLLFTASGVSDDGVGLNALRCRADMVGRSEVSERGCS